LSANLQNIPNHTLRETEGRVTCVHAGFSLDEIATLKTAMEGPENEVFRLFSAVFTFWMSESNPSELSIRMVCSVQSHHQNMHKGDNMKKMIMILSLLISSVSFAQGTFYQFDSSGYCNEYAQGSGYRVNHGVGDSYCR